MIDILDELLVESARENPGENTTPTSSRPPVQKLNYSHNGMIDLILANPGISQNAIAAKFGYSASWVSQVMSSDAFQAALAKRAEEIVDPALKMTVKENFEAIVRRSQEVLMEKLSKPTECIPDQLVVQALSVASKAAGYGAKQEAPPPAPTEIHLHLEQHAERLTHLLRRKKTEIIDAEIEQIAGVIAEG